MSDLYKRFENAGYTVTCNPPGNGDCFYAAAAFQLGLDVESVKKVVFAHLEKHQFDVSTLYLFSV